MDETIDDLTTLPPPSAGNTPNRRIGALRLLTHPATRLLTLSALIAAVALWGWSAGLDEPAHFREIATHGNAGTPLLVIAGVAGLALMLFPRAGIAVGAGLLFPPFTAVVYALVGTMLGAATAFCIGRLCGKDLVKKLNADRRFTQRLLHLEKWLHRRGFLSVLYTRLLPVLPFGLLSYIFGTTPVGFGTFLLGTGLGIAPSTVLLVFAGAAAADPGSPAFVLAVGVNLTMAAIATVVARRHQLTS